MSVCLACEAPVSHAAEVASSRLHALPAEATALLYATFSTPVQEIRLCSACLLPHLSAALQA